MILAGILLVAGTAVSDVQGPYAQQQLDLDVAVASHRPVDGIDYFDDGPLLVAGIRFADPGGFYAASQFLQGEGDGLLLPAASTRLLESAIGWNFRSGSSDLAVELQDYRQRQSGRDSQAYQGAALHYRYRQFSVELGFEEDKPFYFQPLDRFFEYHTRRQLIAWRQPLLRQLSVQFALGRHAIDRVDIRYRHASVRLDGQWGDWRWWLGYSQASEELENFYPAAAGRGSLFLGVGKSFEID